MLPTLPTSFRNALGAVILSALGLGVPITTHSALVNLATEPLAQSTSSTVKPNLLFVLDNSGSMGWTFMPDTANNFDGDYGYHSSQCNNVYYNPAVTYTPPVKADKTSYDNASFTAARDNGFDTASTARNLNSPAADPLENSGAFYYLYTGSVTDKDYSNSGSAFYTECNNSVTNASAVFVKRRLASTMTTTIVVNGSDSTSVSGITVNGTQIMSGATISTTDNNTLASRIAEKITINGYSATASDNVVTITGPASATDFTPVISQSNSKSFTADVFPDTAPDKLTNFANWYSYYRTRMLMMKTAAGQAFAQLDERYRVGLMRINTQGAPALRNDTFSGSQRTSWYSTLYGTSPGGSTPLRRALSDAGRYYSGQFSGTDPIQYSCQQNFTLLSTDGFWNGGAGYQIDGSTAVGNQDGSAQRPMYDGYSADQLVTTIYRRYVYSLITSDCSGTRKRIATQQQRQTCTATLSGGVTGVENCQDWANRGNASTSSCQNTPVLPSPNPSARTLYSSATSAPYRGSEDSLADVAMYYYQTDLRTPALDNCGTVTTSDPEGLCKNNVFAGGSDTNVKQHMTTFTLGLGANGRMRYDPGYLNGRSADYDAVRQGSTASSTASPPVCSWQANGSVCNWPLPGSDKPENIDDMWHAAVNGRGAYFSATDPNSLASGLGTALASIAARKGNSAAAATSTLAPVEGNNFAYLASYTTALWKGNLEARGINVDTGSITANASWCAENVAVGICEAPGTIVTETIGGTQTAYCRTPSAITCNDGTFDEQGNCNVRVAVACQGTMSARVAIDSDTRTIKTPNSTGTALVDFDATYAAANPTPFASGTINQLSQWALLDSTQRTEAAGANLVRYLRGQTQYDARETNAEANRLFRKREAVLGDVLESQPVYIGAPNFSYPYPGYTTFKTNQASRAGTIYLGANDGMLHAFNASNGQESWAFIPSMVVPNLWRLADKNYASLHRNFVNGPPVTSDICTANCSCDTACVTAGGTAPTWKTILVGGLNGGGRGYYAMDITTPSAPSLLWEFTTTQGQGTTKDDDVGYSYGPAQITRKADGTWVVLVTSGYNNVSPGTTGLGYLYVLNASTGAIISKIATSAGTATTPSGLAKIAVWNDEPAGNQAGYVYGGDLLGNVWRFDINSTNTASIGTGSVMKFAELHSNTAGTQAQPIMTTPVLGKIAGKRVVFINTGKYLETGDLTTTQVQSQYAIKDDDATSALINPRTTLVRQTITAGPTTRTISRNSVNFYTNRGWYFDFPDTGERANVDAQLVLGTLLIPSIVPTNTACEPGGYGWLTFVDYLTGGATTQSGLGSLRYPSPIVGINIVYIQGRPKVSVITSGEDPKDPPEIPFSTSTAGFSGTRVLWREIMR